MKIEDVKMMFEKAGVPWNERDTIMTLLLTDFLERDGHFYNELAAKLETALVTKEKIQ